MHSSFKAALIGTLLLGISAPAHATLDEVAQALALGDSVNAITQLKAMPESVRNSYRGRLLHAEALAAQDKREEAVRCYRSLIEEVPGQPEAYNNLAVLYAAEGRLDEALKLLEQAMNTSDSYATVRSNLGRIYLEKSLNSYAKALQVGERKEAPSLQALYRLNDLNPAPAEPLMLAQAEMTQSPAVEPPQLAARSGVPSEPVSAPEAVSEPEPVSAVETVVEPVEPVEPVETVESVESVETVETVESGQTVVVAEAVMATAAEVEVDEAASSTETTGPVAAQTEPAVLPAEQEALEPAADAEPESASEPAAEARQAVLDSVQQWAKAWQGQDVEAYLAAYADGFEPSHDLGREQWQAQRRRRLSKPEHIEVVLEEIEVRFNGDRRARVYFVQRYHSDRYRDTTRKRLKLVNERGGWKILAETTLEVIR